MFTLLIRCTVNFADFESLLSTGSCTKIFFCENSCQLFRSVHHGLLVHLTVLSQTSIHQSRQLFSISVSNLPQNNIFLSSKSFICTESKDSHKFLFSCQQFSSVRGCLSFSLLWIDVLCYNFHSGVLTIKHNVICAGYISSVGMIGPTLPDMYMFMWFPYVCFIHSNVFFVLFNWQAFTCRSGSASMLSLTYSQMLKTIGLYGLPDFDEEISFPHDLNGLPRGYEKQKNKLSDEPNIRTSKSLLVEVSLFRSSFHPLARFLRWLIFRDRTVSNQKWHNVLMKSDICA